MILIVRECFARYFSTFDFRKIFQKLYFLIKVILLIERKTRGFCIDETRTNFIWKFLPSGKVLIALLHFPSFVAHSLVNEKENVEKSAAD